MTKGVYKVLLIDQNSSDISLFQKVFSEIQPTTFNFIFKFEKNLKSSLTYLTQNKVDIIFLDLIFSNLTRLEIIRKVREVAIETPIIVLTQTDDEILGHELLQQGAQDYLVKTNIHSKMLSRTILHSIEKNRLEESLRLQSQIVTHMAEGVCFIRARDAMVVYANSTFESMFGYFSGELFNKPLSILYAPSFEKSAQAQAQETIRQLKKTGKWNGEVHHLKKDESSFWCQANISTFEHPEYGLIWVGVFTDITKRKMAEETLIRTTSELQAIFHAFPDLYFRLNEDGTILDYHAGQSKNLFLSSKDFLGQRLQDILPNKIENQFKQMISLAHQKKEMGSLEYSLNLQNEENFFEARILPLLKDQVLVIVRNITERKKLEKIKDEFISTVSHELRTPLSIIKEAINSLKDELLGPLNTEQKETVDIANRNAYRLSRIINDILDLSKLQSGKITIHPFAVNIAQLLKEATQSFQTIASNKHIQIDIELSEVIPSLICDGNLIERVLGNLLDNAIRFSKSHILIKAVLIQQGHRTLDKKNQKSNSNNSNFIQISVIDDGPGIDKKEVEHLFEKFHQIHRPVGGAGYKGTGLGLAISKEIIELHQGKIWVESTLRKGSQFHFSLPVTLGE